MSDNQRGFTNTELLIMLLAIWLFASLVLASCGEDKIKVHEDEVKANIHTIQMAVERYEVDHKHYPSFLLGGDSKGWRMWHLYHDEPNPPVDEPSDNLVQDVLVQYGYLESYPQNPFVDDGMNVIMSTCVKGSGPSGELRAGDGDPRFGYNGNIMGNGLDDPAYYLNRTEGIPPKETSLIETRRTLDNETVKELGFCEPPEGLHYMMGGRKAFDKYGQVITIAVFWPGNFFYRSAFIHPLERKGWAWYDPSMVPDPPITKYILGAYGSENSAGLDMIRLEARNWDNTDDIYYRLPHPWYKYARSSGIKCAYSLTEEEDTSEGGLPELFGGGDAFTGPFFPPNRGDESEGYQYGQYIYGAPDGHPDGIIIVVTDSDYQQVW